MARLNTPATRSFSHALTFGIDLAVMSNILQYVYNKTKQNRANFQFRRKWGPFLCCFVALFACMADLTRHLVNDAWGTVCTELDRDKYPDSVIAVMNGPDGPVHKLGSTYSKYCYSQNVANEFSSTGLWGLSVWGWVFTVFLTWFGFLMLFVGIFWAVSLPQKLRAQWRSIRENRARRAEGAMQTPMVGTQ